MQILRDGTFAHTVKSDDLAAGLRPSKRTPRNSKYLVECVGAVGLDMVLQVIDDLEDDRIDTSVITDGFPYPQIFILTYTVLICGQTDIYEWDGAAMTHVLGPVTSGQLWAVADFLTFIYMSNGEVAVTRDPQTGSYALTSDYPKFRAICNYNGQVVIGSPED